MQISDRKIHTRLLSHPAKKSLTIIGLAITVMLAGCSESEDEKARREHSVEQNNGKPVALNLAQPSKPYEVMVATPGNSRSMVSLGATVAPKTELTIRAQAPGRVVFIAGEEGTQLRRGQTIIDLDDKSLVAKRRAAQAGLSRAQAQLQNAYIQLDQNIISEGVNTRGGMGMPSMFDKFITQGMGDMAGVGDSDYDRYASISQSRTGVEQAKSAVMEAESGIEQINSMFRDKKAVAPADTIILEKMVELGDAVQPGQALVKIGDVSSLQVIVDVPARLMGSLKQGMDMPIHIDVTNVDVKGRIIRIFPSANAERHTVRVKIALPNRTPATPGMYATVMVPDSSSGNTQSLSIPTSAIVWRGSQASVYTVDQTNKASLRMIRAGAKSGKQISILSGVSNGDRVITNPDSGLRSGTMVQVVPARIQGQIIRQRPSHSPTHSSSYPISS